MFDDHKHHFCPPFFHHKHHHATSLEFTFSSQGIKVKGDFMQLTMQVKDAAGNQSTVSVIGSPVTAVLDANGNPLPSTATLSNPVYTSSDPTVFTVAPDPSTPNGAVITTVGTGTATLTEVATATEPDGKTTEQIQGVATIIITAVPVVPPVAASLQFTFGTPQ